ncbi:MAG: hypothetical protein QM706_16845 [Nitrospira sp.]
MTHDELEASVPLDAAGALERVERQALEAHLLSGCIPCRTTLKEYQSVVVTLPFKSPHHVSSSDVERQDHVVPPVAPCH